MYDTANKRTWRKTLGFEAPNPENHTFVTRIELYDYQGVSIHPYISRDIKIQDTHSRDAELVVVDIVS